MKTLIFTLSFFLLATSTEVYSSEALSYSGRLVNTDGSPVSGPVNLRFDVAYSNDPSQVVCFKTLTSVPLTNGVFHTKLDFQASDCAGTNLSSVLLATPLSHSPIIRVADLTNAKTYSYQTLQTMPFSMIADMAKTLSPLPASDVGKVLQWNGTNWEPATLGTGTGSVTSVATGTGLTGGPITSMGTISIATGGVGTTQLANGAVTSAKIAAGSANHVLVNDGSGNFSSTATIGLTQGGTGASSASGARTSLGLGTAATADVAYATGSVMPGFAIPTCVSGYKLHFTGVGPTWWSCIVEDGGDTSKLPLAGGTMSGNIAMGGSKVTGLAAPTAGTDAATKSYVDTQISSESVWAVNSGNATRASGNVGIGTTSPSAALTIARDTGVSSDILLANSHNNWTVKTGTTGNSLSIVDNQWGNRFHINPIGSIGIGTDTPVINTSGKAIHVHESSANASGIHFTNATTGAGAGQGFFVGRWADGSYDNGPIVWNYNLTPITFGTNSMPRMVISAQGDVGIGVTAPNAGLQLRAGTATSAPLKLTSGVNLTTPQAGAIEFDGSNLYFTNSANLRKTLATSTGATTIQPAAGSATSPSYSFDSDTTSGFYSAGTGSIGVAAGGSSLFTFGSNGLVSSTAGGGKVGSAAGTATQPTFSFAGDPDTGWYSPLANTLAASTAGTERVRITDNGFVGIGVTNPQVPLAVKNTGNHGQLHLSGGNLDPASTQDFTYLSSGDLLVGTNRQAGWVETDFINARANIYGGGFRFYDYNLTSNTLTPLMALVSDTGFLGLGTSTPQAKLHVVNGDSSVTLYGPNTTYGASLVVGAASTNLSATKKAQVIVSNGNLHLDAAPGYDTFINHFNTRHTFINSAGGQLGVGTTTPSAKLEVAGPADSSVQLYVGNSVTANSKNMYFSRYGGATSPMGIQGARVGVGVENLTLQAQGGFVGVGTNTPDEKLDVAGKIRSSGFRPVTIDPTGGSIRTQGDAGGWAFGYGANGSAGTYRGEYGILGSADALTRFYIGTYNTDEKVSILANGNTGIGTTAPTAKLQVNGDFRLGLDDGLDTDSYGSTLEFLGTTSNGDPLHMRRYNIAADQTELRMNIGDDKQANDAFVVGLNYFADSLWHSVLRVQANGNVAIGRTSSTARLHLAAGTASQFTAPLKFTQGVNLTTPEPGAIEYDGTNLYFTNQSSVRQTIATASTGGVVAATNSVVTPAVYGASTSGGTLTLDSTSHAGKGNVLIAPAGGNVGIGVLAPHGMLSNSNTNRADEVSLGLGTMALNWTGLSVGYVAGFENTATGNAFNGVLVKIADVSSQSKALNVMSGGTPRFVVKGDGKVGVGPVDPGNFFTVSGQMVTKASNALPFGNSQMSVRGLGASRSPTEGAALGFILPADADGTNPWEQGRIIVTPNSSATSNAHGVMGLQTRYHDGSIWQWRNNLTLLPNGNVGVNNTAPNAALTVTGIGGNGTGPAILEVQATNPQPYTWATYTKASTLGTNQAIINLFGKSESTYNLAYFGYKHVADGSVQNKMTFGFYNVDDIMTLNASKNLGINDTDPQAPVSVGGPNGAFLSLHPSGANGYLAGAFGSGMHWNGSNWVSRGDGGSNGGGMIAASKGGNLNFYAVPNTAGTDRIIPDANISDFGIMSVNYDRSVNVFGGMFARGGAPGLLAANRNGYAFHGIGDNDSGLFSLADGQVSLFTDGVERLKLGLSSAILAQDLTTRSLALGPADNSYRGAIYFSSTNDNNHKLYNNILNVDGQGAFDGIKWNVYDGIQIRVKPAGALEAFRINQDGLIGMGVTNPTERLEVAGNVKANAFLYNSDARLKKNVHAIENPLEKIMRLRGVNFTWKSSNEKTTGFIAQEVEKVVPELVKTNKSTTLKSVHYSNIIAIVVEAIKELRGESKREVAALRTENKNLRQRVEALELERARARDLEKRLEKLEQRAAIK